MSADQPPVTVNQCATCPWKVETVPDKDIPNGYHVDLHASLRCTIQSGLDSLFRSSRTAMACHYSKRGEEFVCAGWLHHQLGVGNNIGVRLMVATGKLPVPAVDGEQHESFEATLPSPKKKTRAPRQPRSAQKPRRKNP